MTTRQRLTDEALELFYQQGFRTTTMREITMACQLTPAAFYNHFESKDELLYTIIMDSFADLEHDIDMELGRSLTGYRDQLDAVIRAVTKWHCRKSHQAKVANRESLELPPAMLDRVLQRRRTLRDSLERIIIGGTQAGEFVNAALAPEETARRTSTAFFGLVTSVSDWYSESDTWTADLLIDLFVQLSDRMVGARTDALPPASPLA